MKTYSFVAAGLFALGMGAAPVAAQQGDWEYEGTFYLFMTETTTSITTPVRTIESELSFSDALANLDVAFMGAFGASNGRWSFLLDYMYTDLSFGNALPGPNFTSLDSSVKTQILTGFVGYRVYQDPTLELDLGAGFRWFDTKASMTLLPVPPGGTTTFGDDWVDPIIGLRARFRFSDRWTGTALFDYGGFESDNDTWQALLTADYAINENWVLRGGYRYITFDRADGGNSFSFTQSGPIVGVTYRF